MGSNVLVVQLGNPLASCGASRAMEQSHVDPKVMGACREVADLGVFWREETHGKRCIKDVHCVISLVDSSQEEVRVPSDLASFHRVGGLIIKPALSEFTTTPCNDRHVLTHRPVTFLWHPELTRVGQCTKHALHQGDLVCVLNCEIVWFHEHMLAIITPAKGSCVAWPKGIIPSQLNVAEIFAGGFAGWCFATRHLQAIGTNIFSRLLVDNDRATAFMAARNHDLRITPSGFDARSHEVPSEKGICVTADVQEHDWLILCSLLSISVWLTSPPCPAFSLASNMLGFLRKEGQMTLHLACCARLCQPVAVVIENVKGLSDHKFFHILIAMFKWAGYTCLSHETMDLGDVAPCARDRWFGFFIRKDLASHFRPIKKSWFRVADFKFESFGLARLNIPLDIIKLYTLTTELEMIYGNPKHLPKKMRPVSRNILTLSPQEICVLRCIRKDSKLATFVATYGHQHDLPADFLADSEGIFAQLIQFRQFFRFLTPFEQCLSFAVPGDIFIPVHPQLAFRFVGNCVAPLQALYVITNLLQSMGFASAPSVSPMQSVVNMHTQRMMPSSVSIKQQGDWFVMYQHTEPMLASDDELVFPLHPFVPHENQANVDNLCPRVDTAAPPSLGVFPLDSAAEAAIERTLLAEHDRASFQPLQQDVATELDQEREHGERKVGPISATLPWNVVEDEPPAKRSCLPPKVEHSDMINVTFVLPHDVLNIRCKVGSKVWPLLHSHGYIPEAFVLTDVNTQKDVMHSSLTADTIIVARNDFRHMAHHVQTKMKEAFEAFSQNLSGDQVTTATISCVGITIWKGILPTMIPIRTIHEVTTKVFRAVGIHADCRWTKATIVINPFWEWKLKDLSSSGSIKLQVHLPFSGGGPNDPRIDEKTKTKLVGELASANVGFAQLMPVATTIANRFSLAKIKEALAIEDSHDRHERILTLAKEAGVDPSTSRQRHKAATKIQRAVRGKNETTPKVIDVATLKLFNGDFLNQDDSHTEITIGEFSPNGSGLFVVQPSQVATWIRSAKPICTDELAVLLLGHDYIETSLPQKRIQFRATQTGGQGQLVLKGTLIQLGEKTIKGKPFKDTVVACPDTVVATCTVHQEDFTMEEWKQVTLTPGKCMMAAFDHKLRQEAILGLWGHSFQANFRPCKPALADSIQIHVRVKKDALGDILQQSGWNRVFMVPKNDDNFAANVTYSVLWTGNELEQTQIQAKLLQSNLGLIKNRGRFGIRVHFDAFKKSWELLFPDAAVPDQIKVTQIFRVQGLPPNVSNSEIKKWIEQLSWEAKPIRRVAHGIWLVGGSKMPDQETCTFNGNVIMISLVDRRDNADSNPVIAGKALFATDNHQLEPLLLMTLEIHGQLIVDRIL